MTPITAQTLDFESAIAAHRGILIKVAASYAFDPDDRADLVQEIALQLWRAWKGFDPSRTLSTWMYRIALNVAITHRRRAARRHGHEPLDAGHESLVGAHDVDAETRERLGIVQTAMRGLGALDRALLLLHLDGLGNAETGEVLGMSEGNVATRLTRIRQQLRRHAGAHTQGE